MTPPLRVAIVGAGPAGIYAADILTTKNPEASVDIFDRMPTPYGLIRYGVAPDHPRIKAIIVALHRVMEKEQIRFIGNVHVGVDIKVDELRQFYDAVIFATGAERDRSLRIPGEDLQRSYGAADFVAFYDSHPDREQTWDLSQQRSVAVIGVGNVGLDVARMLARTADELLATDIPPHVHAVLADSPSPTCTCSPGAARPRPSSPRSNCASWITPPTCRSSSRPRAWSSTPTSEAALSRSKSLRMVVDVLQRLGDARPGAGPAPPDPPALPGEPGRDPRRPTARSSGCAPNGRN